MAEGKADQVRAIVAGSEQVFCEGWETDFLSPWVAAETAHREPEAATQWALAQTVANALAAAGGDRMPADLMAQMELLRQTDPAKLRRLLPGFVAYFEALDLRGKPAALGRFQAARRILEVEGSP